MTDISANKRVFITSNLFFKRRAIRDTEERIKCSPVNATLAQNVLNRDKFGLKALMPYCCDLFGYFMMLHQVLRLTRERRREKRVLYFKISY
jgi:hypothetical protein